MKRLFPSLLLAAAVFTGAGPSAANDLGMIRLSLIEGDVQVLIQDTTDWTPAAVNLPLNEHDRLWVPVQARAELQVQGGVIVRAENASGLDILTVNRDSAQFYLDQGHVYINNRKGGINTVQVDTPAASMRSYDNSIMMVDVTETGDNEISVLKGTVTVESRSGATQVNAGSTLTISGDSDARIAPIGAPDDWEQWNTDRDSQVLGWSESSRYLPSELQEYSSDLDQNGSWDYVSDYGYVWYPTYIDAGWTPYSYGSWLWIHDNYVWVDYDRWGWAPSHYGRWMVYRSRWCWVPPARGTVYWGPGYVGWVVTPTYVAWVPLAPGEVYYGYGYYGPGSVNITTVNINTVVVNRNYRNAQHPHSVVTADRSSFGTGRRVPARVEGNPFEHRHGDERDVRVVPPRVRPEHPVTVASPEVREHQRLSFERVRPDASEARPVPGTSSVTVQKRPETGHPGPRVLAPPATPQMRAQQSQPPERFRSSRPETMKNERPLVRQREGSVFRAQPPENMPVTRSHEPRVIQRAPAAQGQRQHREQKAAPDQGAASPQQQEREGGMQQREGRGRH